MRFWQASAFPWLPECRARSPRLPPRAASSPTNSGPKRVAYASGSIANASRATTPAASFLRARLLVFGQDDVRCVGGRLSQLFDDGSLRAPGLRGVKSVLGEKPPVIAMRYRLAEAL